MAAGDVKETFAGVVTAISSGAIADGATSESAAQDNSSSGYHGAFIELNISAGAGAHADGVVVYQRRSVDGGTAHEDAETAIIGTCPSPNSGTKRRVFHVYPLASNFKLGIKNDSAAEITAELKAHYYYYNVAQS